MLGCDELPTTDEDSPLAEPASANFRVLGSMVHFNGEPEADEVPKAGASLFSLGAGFASKSAVMYAVK